MAPQPRDIATLLASQTALGAAKVVLETGDHPALLKDAVTTPAGCTIDAIMELEEGKLRVTLINHATVLLQQRGCNLLTDPIWSERASPVSWTGPRRHRRPGVAFENLPEIDAVLISHNHYDHLDRPAVKRLAFAHPEATWIVAAGLGHYIGPWGARNVVVFKADLNEFVPRLDAALRQSEPSSS